MYFTYFSSWCSHQPKRSSSVVGYRQSTPGGSKSHEQFRKRLPGEWSSKPTDVLLQYSMESDIGWRIPRFEKKLHNHPVNSSIIHCSVTHQFSIGFADNTIFDDTHDKVSNTHNIATLGGCIPSTIPIPSSSVQHTHVITCSSLICSTNVLTNTQSHFYTTSTHQPIAGVPECSHIFQPHPGRVNCQH